MDYYISWTHSDPIYHEYIGGIGVLVSPPNVNRSWSVDLWPFLPSHLIIDSGAYQYYRLGRSPQPGMVLDRQLAMIAPYTARVGICHLDVPLLGQRDHSELQRRVLQSLENARWLMTQVQERRLPPNIEPIGVIQGFSVESIYFVAQALEDMGYKRFALGSLVALVQNAHNEVLRRVEAAIEAVGPALHILGVSSVSLLPELLQLGVQSVDSSAPMREAWLGGIFYSHPFRRYKLSSPHFKEWRRNYSFAEILNEPEPCDCPVCQVDSSRILVPRGKEYVNLRAIHNCYHLTREFTSAMSGAN